MSEECVRLGNVLLGAGAGTGAGTGASSLRLELAAGAVSGARVRPDGAGAGAGVVATTMGLGSTGSCSRRRPVVLQQQTDFILVNQALGNKAHGNSAFQAWKCWAEDSRQSGGRSAYVSVGSTVGTSTAGEGAGPGVGTKVSGTRVVTTELSPYCCSFRSVRENGTRCVS